MSEIRRFKMRSITWAASLFKKDPIIKNSVIVDVAINRKLYPVDGFFETNEPNIIKFLRVKGGVGKDQEDPDTFAKWLIPGELIEKFSDKFIAGQEELAKKKRVDPKHVPGYKVSKK